jgi:hypothetical protein
MVSVLASTNSAILALNIILSAAAGSQHCTNLHSLYQQNVDTMSIVVEQYQKCSSLHRSPQACPDETRDLVTLQEALQAVFQKYLMTCGSRSAAAAGREPGPLGPAS